jgi:cardiolipin synthase
MALALSACAVPDIDRHMLHAARTPARFEGSRGPLTHAQGASIIAGLKARSPETSILDRHLAVEEALAGNPLSVGNKVTLLEDGPATYASMLEAIRGARHHIHMESYIFEADEVGARFAEALKGKAKAGVKVRLVYDSLGSNGTPNEFFQAIADSGAEVYEFNPVSAKGLLTRGAGLNRRNHRKLTLVDGRVAFVGGINISSVYTTGSSAGLQGGGSRQSARSRDEPKQPPWRDTHVRIEGPVVGDFQKGFLKMWAKLEKKPPLADAALFPAPGRQGPHAVRAVEGWVGEGANPLYVTLISAIENAQTEVQITMAYFVPHAELLASLKAAVARGVDVKLLLPGHTDHWLVFHAGRSYYDELLQAGVKIYERQTRLLHAKTAIVDGVWCTVGSTNLDWRSLVDNDEVNAVVLSPEFAAQLKALFAKDLERSTAITPRSWRNRPLDDRMREVAARAWARLL